MNHDSAPLNTQFSSLSSLLKSRSIPHAYDSNSAINFNLTQDQSNFLETGIKKYLTVLEQADSDDVDFTNSKELLNAAIKALRIQLPNGVFEKIDKSDYIEIYTDNMVPAFKSANFWGNSSYTLDQLYSQPYDQLYGRDEFYQASMDRSARHIFSGALPVIDNPVPEHVAWELQGPLKRKIRYKFFSAVYDLNGMLIGGLVSSEIMQLSN